MLHDTDLCLHNDVSKTVNSERPRQLCGSSVSPRQTHIICCWLETEIYFISCQLQMGLCGVYTPKTLDYT